MTSLAQDGAWQLRVATADDALAVADVLIASRRAFLPYAPLAHGDEDVRRWVRDQLIPGGGVTVACDGHLVVGMVAMSQEPAAAWIDQLYVSPNGVGQGIGSALLVHALASLKRPVRLHCFAANMRARTFYERHGFVAVAFSDGQSNEERCPDVLYELASHD